MGATAQRSWELSNTAENDGCHGPGTTEMLFGFVILSIAKDLRDRNSLKPMAPSPEP